MTTPRTIDELAGYPSGYEDDAPPALADYAERTPAPTESDDVPASRRQIGQLVELFVEGEESYTVRIANRERIAYEKIAARHQEWPSLEGGPHFAMTFMVWVAAKRDGRTSLTFERWQDALEDWEPIKAAPADPTR